MVIVIIILVCSASILRDLVEVFLGKMFLPPPPKQTFSAVVSTLRIKAKQNQCHITAKQISILQASSLDLKWHFLCKFLVAYSTKKSAPTLMVAEGKETHQQLRCSQWEAGKNQSTMGGAIQLLCLEELLLEKSFYVSPLLGLKVAYNSVLPSSIYPDNNVPVR